MPYNKQDILDRITAGRIVAVLTLEDEAAALPVADALLEGGIDIIELTLRTPAAEACIRRIAAARPSMLVGAGTVLSPGQLDRARAAGAAFAVSPGLNHAVSRAAESEAYPYFPGVMTPTDIETAIAMGHHLLKFFPAESAGGVAMLKALAAPYAQAGVRFMPLGGINAENVRSYCALPVVAAIGGSWIAQADLIKSGRFDNIRDRAREACAIIRG